MELAETLCRRLAFVRLLMLHHSSGRPVPPPSEAVAALKSIGAYVHTAGPRAGSLDISLAFARVEDAVRGVLALARRDEATVLSDRLPKCRLLRRATVPPHLVLSFFAQE